MVDAFTLNSAHSVAAYERRAQRSWWLMFLGLVGVSGLLCLSMLRSGPSWSPIVWLLYLAGLVAICYQPRYGVYLLVFLTLFGDWGLVPWYPFTKNFSTVDSPLYIARAVIISPLEVYLGVTLLVWLGRMAMERRIRIFAGVLAGPAALFTGFIIYGLVYGLSRHGNVNAALWEARAIFYLPAMLVLTGNLIRTRPHVSALFWCIAISLSLKGLAGVAFVGGVLNWDLAGVESIGLHTMSIHFNAFFVLLIAAWFYHDSTIKRLVLPLLLPFVLYSFFANHRRAGFLTLGIAVGLIFLLLYRENRRLFWAIAPTSALIFCVYLAAFWNSAGSIGIIARAVRSVIGQPTVRDASSNAYRDIENVNIMFSLKAAPLLGLGFGQKFYIVMPMPDISLAFEWWEYITHNSIMWVWMKTGVGGFFSMLTLVGMALIVGGRAIWNMPRGPLRGAALTATLYIMMHFIFAYVDMSWETNSMVLVGTMMGLLNCLELVAAAPIALPARRWPWQPEPQAPLERDAQLPPPRGLPLRRAPRTIPALTRTWRSSRRATSAEPIYPPI